MMTRNQTRKALASEPGWTSPEPGDQLADVWEAIGLAASDFERRRKAVARDQIAALVTSYVAQAAAPGYGEDFITHEQLGNAVAADERLTFWAEQLLAGS